MRLFDHGPCGLIQSSELSEAQAALAGALGERLHAPVVAVAAAVEHGTVDAGGEGALGQQCTGAAGLVHWGQVAQGRLGPVDRRDRAAGVVVDQLREDAAVGAEHGDPGTLGGALDLRAYAPAALET